jgi:hypothetical protein
VRQTEIIGLQGEYCISSILNLLANRHPESDTCQAPKDGCDKGVTFTNSHGYKSGKKNNGKQKGGSPEGTTFLGFYLAVKLFSIYCC